MVVADEKDPDEQLAIQLSHNAIAGQDDLVILKELWESIKDVQARIYAGLDSDTVKALQGIQFAAITEQRLRYKLIKFLFLPEEIERPGPAPQGYGRGLRRGYGLPGQPEHL